MKLLVRTLGNPVPQEVPCTAGQSVGGFLAALADNDEQRNGQPGRHKLVYRGRVLHDPAAKLCDVVADGDVLVLLPRRSVAPRPPPPEPSRGPTLREINAAVREDLAAQGPGRLEAAEAAARREGQARGGGGGLDVALPDLQSLEQALVSGDMGALRAYLDQLQGVVHGAGELAGGLEGDAAAEAPADEPSLTTALDLMVGLLGDAARREAGALQHGGEEDVTEEEEEEEEEEEDMEHETDEEEEDGEHSDEEEEEEEEEGASDEEASEDEHDVQPLQIPAPDARLLAELTDMGFAEPLCRNALLMGRNRFEPALEWLLEHAEDPAAAEPLSDAQLARLYGRAPRRAGRPVDQGALAMLQDMGFDRQQAEQALRTFNNSLNAATSWLLNLGALATAAPQAAGGGPQAAAGSGQAQEQGGPAAAEQQQAEAGEDSDSDAAQSVHSSAAEVSEPAGADQDQVPGLACDGGSSSGSDEEHAQPQQPAAQAQQPVLQQEGDDGLPALDSGSDDGSSYDGSARARQDDDASGNQQAVHRQ